MESDPHMFVKRMFIVWLCLSIACGKCEDRSNQTDVIERRPTSMQVMSEERATSYLRQIAKRVPKFFTSMFGTIRFYARNAFNAYTFYGPELGFGKCFYDVMSLRYPTTMRGFSFENALSYVSNSYDRITSTVAKYVDNVRKEELFSDESIDAKISDFGEADMKDYLRQKATFIRIYGPNYRLAHRQKHQHQSKRAAPNPRMTSDTNKPPTGHDKMQLNVASRQFNASPQQLQQLMFLRQQQLYQQEQQEQYQQQQLLNYNLANYVSNYNGNPQIGSAVNIPVVTDGGGVGGAQAQEFNVNSNVINPSNVNDEELPSLSGCVQSYALGVLWRTIENLLGG